MQQEEHTLSLDGNSPAKTHLRRPRQLDRFESGTRGRFEEASRGREVTSSDSGDRSRVVVYQPVLLVAMAITAGVVADRFLVVSFKLSFTLAVVALLVWFLTGLFSSLRSQGKMRRWILFRSSILLLGIAMIGSAWHHGYWNFYGADEIGRFASDVSRPCCLDATIVSEPKRVGLEANSFSSQDEAEQQTRFSVRVNRLRDGVRWRKVSGQSELIVHDTTELLHAGDRVRIHGSLVGVTPPTNPGQFDFGRFYRGKRKLAFIHAYSRHSVEVLEPSNWRTTHWISDLRRRLNAITWCFVAEEQAPFASAILLGNREQLSKARRDRFVETGTVHLLAISGLHVGILAGAFLVLLRLPLFSRQTCLWATIGFVIFYAWLVEFRPPATRASILIVLFCLGRMIGERTFSMNLLAVAAVIVIALNPTDVFAIGPQLSFLAVATLAIGKEWIFWPPSKDPLDRLIANTRSAPVRVVNWLGRQARTAVLVSSVIWILAMPILANRFHLVSLSALVVNPFLLLPVALALYSGLALLLTGGWIPGFASACGYFCQRNLALVEWSVMEVHQVSWGHLWTSGPSWVAVIFFYFGAVVFAAFPPTRLRGRWLVLMISVWVVLGWWLPSQIRQVVSKNRNLACTFLDVGHGASVLLEMPNGENWLYDAGAMGAADYGARNIASALWYQGIDRLDAIVISHADSDHFNAIPELLKQFSVDRVYVSRKMANSSSPAVRRLLEQLSQLGVAVEVIHKGWRLEFSPRGFGGVDSADGSKGVASIEVLSPNEEGFGENDNSDSIVLDIKYQGLSILLPGDLEKSGLENLLATDPKDFDIVLAPHHGSGNSAPERFMRWATPEFVVISGGAQRVSDAVEQRFVSDRFETISRTDRDGAIRAMLSSKGVRWEHWCEDHWQEVSRQ